MADLANLSIVKVAAWGAPDMQTGKAAFAPSPWHLFSWVGGDLVGHNGQGAGRDQTHDQHRNRTGAIENAFE